MCEIAPFEMECEFDDHKNDLVCCRSCMISFYLQQLVFRLPIVGKVFEKYEKKYECPYFEPKGEK